MAQKYPPMTYERHRARKAKGWAIAETGGNMSDLARAEGVSTCAIHKWLAYWPDLHEALLDGRRTNTVSNEISDHRLRTVALADLAGQKRSVTAQQLGLSPAGLSLWLGRRQGELFDMINEIRNEQEGQDAT